jgi:hypothetical protein
VYLIIGAVMKINIKHYSDEATHAANKQQRKNRGNNVYGEENVFNSDADVDGNGKSLKKNTLNEQKRLYLHRLH